MLAIILEEIIRRKSFFLCKLFQFQFYFIKTFFLYHCFTDVFECMNNLELSIKYI